MNNKIKVALAMIAGGALVYLGRKIKNRKNDSEVFVGEDGIRTKRMKCILLPTEKSIRTGKNYILKHLKPIMSQIRKAILKTNQYQKIMMHSLKMLNIIIKG